MEQAPDWLAPLARSDRAAADLGIGRHHQFPDLRHKPAIARLRRRPAPGRSRGALGARGRDPLGAERSGLRARPRNDRHRRSRWRPEPPGGVIGGEANRLHRSHDRGFWSRQLLFDPVRTAATGRKLGDRERRALSLRSAGSTRPFVFGDGLKIATAAGCSGACAAARCLETVVASLAGVASPLRCCAAAGEPRRSRCRFSEESAKILKALWLRGRCGGRRRPGGRAANLAWRHRGRRPTWPRRCCRSSGLRLHIPAVPLPLLFPPSGDWR